MLFSSLFRYYMYVVHKHACQAKAPTHIKIWEPFVLLGFTNSGITWMLFRNAVHFKCTFKVLLAIRLRITRLEPQRNQTEMDPLGFLSHLCTASENKVTKCGGLNEKHPCRLLLMVPFLISCATYRYIHTCNTNRNILGKKTCCLSIWFIFLKTL